MNVLLTYFPQEILLPWTYTKMSTIFKWYLFIQKNIYCMLGTFIGAKDTEINKTDMIKDFIESKIRWGVR